MIWTAVLGLGFIFALAGDFVLWAKLDEQKQKTADEHANYLAALRLHNDAAEASQGLKEVIEDRTKDVLYYYAECTKLAAKRNVLQDRLSAILCPNNDHVWKDGRCVKCGRVKDAAD